MSSRAETVYPDLPDIAPGTLVTIRWDPSGRTKRAQFVRSTRTGKIVVRVEGVTVKGEPTGKFGSERTFERHDLVAVHGVSS